MNLFYQIVSILLVFSLWFDAIPIATCEEPQAWNALTVRKLVTDSFYLDTYIHARADVDYSVARLFQISERVGYFAHENLVLSTNYSFFAVQREDAGEESFANQHRFEFEANPLFTLTEQIRYRSRNRIETLYDEGMDHLSDRFRHRSVVEVSLPDTWGASSAYTSMEYFYLFQQGDWNQARIVPIGLRFSLSSSLILSAYPMLQVNKQDDSWSTRPILGIDLEWNAASD